MYTTDWIRGITILLFILDAELRAGEVMSCRISVREARGRRRCLIARGEGPIADTQEHARRNGQDGIDGSYPGRLSFSLDYRPLSVYVSWICSSWLRLSTYTSQVTSKSDKEIGIT